MSIKSLFRKQVFTASKAELRSQVLATSEQRQRITNVKVANEEIARLENELAAKTATPLLQTPAARTPLLQTSAESKKDFSLQSVRDNIAESRKLLDNKQSIYNRMSATGVSGFGKNFNQIVAEIEYAEGIKALADRRSQSSTKQKEAQFNEGLYYASDAKSTSYNLTRQGYQLVFDANSAKTLCRVLIKKDRRTEKPVNWVWESLRTKSGDQLGAVEFNAILAGKPSYAELSDVYCSSPYSGKVEPTNEVILW